MPYPEAMVTPMRNELVDLGARELRTAAEVDLVLNETSGTQLLLVNSVCGCAAGSARPALKLAMQHDTVPDTLTTVFAGQDLEATDRARHYIGNVPPSSPSFALFKNGELVHFLPRHMVEGRSPGDIARDLTAGFDEFCN